MSRRDKIVLLIHASTFSQPQPKVDTFPWGVLHLAAGLKKAGIQSRIIDLNIEKLTETHLKDVGCVGISTTSYAIRSAIQAAIFVRKINPSIPIIWGGVHPSLDPQNTIQHPLVDAVFRGEGDIAFPVLCKIILGRKSYNYFPNLLTKTDYFVIPIPAIIANLDTLPPLPYEFLDLSCYNERILEVHTGRGCPYRCGFCYNVGKKYRSKSTERILEDLFRAWKIFPDARILIFNDDQFFSSLTKVQEICEALLKNGINLPWVANCRIEDIIRMDQSFFQLLRQSRCSLLKAGVESGSERIQKLIGKENITPEMVKEAVVRCRDHKIGLKLNFMIGFPTETIEDLQFTGRLIADCLRLNPRIKRIVVGVYDPYPSTPMWPLALESGYEAPKTLEDWGQWRGELTRLRWLSRSEQIIIRNFLFLTLPFDKPYSNTVSGLWSRQPINSSLWKIWERFIRFDFLYRSKKGRFRFVPERLFYEQFYSKVGVISPLYKQ